MSEALFLTALKKAVAQWPGAQLVDYCCAESGIMGKTSHPHPKYTLLVVAKINHCCFGLM